MDLPEALDDAYALARIRVAGIKPEHWNLSTPCGEWDVGRIALHLARVMEYYDLLLTDSLTPDAQEQLFEMTNTPETAAPILDEVSQRLRTRFRGTGILAKAVPYTIEPFDGSNVAHFSILECCIHSWDIAQAIGVDGRFGEELARVGYDGATPFIDRIREVGFTKPPVTDEPTEDSAQGRLLHLFGRTP